MSAIKKVRTAGENEGRCDCSLSSPPAEGPSVPSLPLIFFVAYAGRKRRRRHVGDFATADELRTRSRRGRPSEPPVRRKRRARARRSQEARWAAKAGPLK